MRVLLKKENYQIEFWGFKDNEVLSFQRKEIFSIFSLIFWVWMVSWWLISHTQVITCKEWKRTSVFRSSSFWNVCVHMHVCARVYVCVRTLTSWHTSLIFPLKTIIFSWQYCHILGLLLSSNNLRHSLSIVFPIHWPLPKNWYKTLLFYYFYSNFYLVLQMPQGTLLLMLLSWWIYF